MDDYFTRKVWNCIAMLCKVRPNCTLKNNLVTYLIFYVMFIRTITNVTTYLYTRIVIIKNK